MNYWHMQLHPDDINWGREEELLEKYSLIGLGLSTEKQTEAFLKEVKPFDIVLIRKGSTPIALIEVDGELEDIGEERFDALDWFRYRRKVKVLDIFNKTKLDFSDKSTNDFPSPRGTLTLAKNSKSPSYQYIQNWHKALFPELYQTNDSLKICEVNIHNYKIFKNFKIDFTNNNKPLPIIVLGGINGSGKTTLLEYIGNFISVAEKDNRGFIKLDRFSVETNKISDETFNFNSLWSVTKDSKKETFISKLYHNRIIYFTTNKSIDELESFLVKFTTQTMHEKDLKPSQVFDNIRKQINKILKELEISVEFDKVDEKGKVFFRNKKGENFLIDEISTGEKTLLSKVLYLYLKEIKDSIILIDEPELSLHPSWQNKVLKLYENFAKANNCQIIIATHSPHIIAHTPHKYLRFLIEENGEIISKELTSTPLDRDINTIIKTIMGVEVIPQDLEKMHQKYRKLLKEKKLDTQEAKELKDKILEQESINSSFFQEIFFDTELLK